MNLPDSGRHVTRVNQGLFSTTMEAEKRDPGNEVDRLWENRLHFPRKRGFPSYYVCLSLNGSRKEKTVNSRNGGFQSVSLTHKETGEMIIGLL